jgi:hypothetical protein
MQTKVLSHYPIGGSKAARILNCPGSIDLEARAPYPGESPYAREGNALHDAMEYLLDSDDVRTADDVLGLRFNGYTITKSYITECIGPSLRYFDKVVGSAPYEVEITALYPDLDDAGGTTDILFQPKPRHMGMIDWKFGKGVKVFAEDNAQMQFYLTCIISERDLWDEIDTLDLHICQPRLRHFDSWTLSIDQLADFRRRFTEAVLGPATLKTGSWCKFCKAAATCPARAREARNALLHRERGGKLSEMIDLAPRLRDLADEIMQAAQASLEQGGSITGWKLVEKRASRHWAIDEKQVAAYLRQHGLTEDQFAPRSLVSVAAAEKLLKAQGDKVQDDKVKKVSSGHTIAPDSDPRDSVAPSGHRDLSALAAFIST